MSKKGFDDLKDDKSEERQDIAERMKLINKMLNSEQLSKVMDKDVLVLKNNNLSPVSNDLSLASSGKNNGDDSGIHKGGIDMGDKERPVDHKASSVLGGVSYEGQYFGGFGLDEKEIRKDLMEIREDLRIILKKIENILK